MAKTNEEVSKELAFGIGILLGAFLFFPLVVFSLPFYLFSRMIRLPRWYRLVPLVGAGMFVGLLFLAPMRYFAFYTVLPISLNGLDAVFGNVPPWSAYALGMYVSGGIGVAFVWGKLTDYVRSKRVLSFEEKREQEKQSKRYAAVHARRFRLNAKAQARWREAASPDPLLLGITEAGKPYAMDFSEINQHMFVPATTGGGKTVLLLSYIEYALRHDYPFIYIDGKGSAESMNDVQTLCTRYGKKLRVFSDQGTVTYNPLKYGNATVIKDKLEQLIATESKYYSELSLSLVQAIIQFIDDYGFSRDLWTFATYLDPAAIKKVLNQDTIVVEREAQPETSPEAEFGSFLDPAPVAASKETRTKQKRTVRSERAEKHYERFFRRYAQEEDGELYLFANASSVRTQIYLLLDSELGELFREAEEDVDLIRVSEEKQALFVSFDGLIYDTFIQVIARFLILDINYLVSYRNRNQLKDAPLLAIYDEFSVYANDKIVDTVNKSRSGGFHCIIATQTLADLEKVSPVLAKQIIGNTNTYAIGQTNHPEEVEAWANLFGTYKDQDLTVKTEAQPGRLQRVDLKAPEGTSRPVHKFKVPPDDIRALRTGQFVFLRKAATSAPEPAVVYVRHPLHSSS
ncbi:TraM recognition domain-containing protein [Thalassobacillus pellis]|uniref:TraM recognition domain-containing protein n=1 Tax=Thalassobacillus pellis TaxID=748008 RepID=UPI001962181E|nr:TraM recognition domain-containing protein [Thalassobacillus pellis]MBM7554422.1 type IV secretory pathway TraG/TraD family ATPase VirD4 [Thalassobacillus pellis]